MATHLLLRIARLLFGAVPQRRGRPARPTRLPLAAASDPFADASAASLATQRSAAARLRHTGQVIGGVSPIDHPAPVRTWIDPWLRQHPVVWAAAGHPAAVFSTTYDELVGMTGAVEVDVASPSEEGGE